MKKISAPATKPRRSRTVAQQSTGISIGEHWAIVAGSKRGPGRHAVIAGSALAPTAVARRPLALDHAASVPESAAEVFPRSGIEIPIDRTPEGGSTIEVKLVQLVGSHKRVLLAGHGIEAIRPELLSRGCRVAVADTRADAPSDVPHHSRAAIRSSDTVEISRKVANQRFEVIALRRLLEYTHDPIGLLARLRKHLTADGYIVAAIPNITHGSIRLRLLAGQSPVTWATSDEPPARFYDGSSAKRLFERAGLTITRIERQTEAFEGALSTLNGASLPPELLAGLMQDADALTSAFVVVAHAFPLTRRTSLDIRMRELADTQRDHRRMLDDLSKQQAGEAARERVDGLARRLEALSTEVTELTRTVDIWHDEGHLATLRRVHGSIVARGADVSATAADLARLAYEQVIARLRAAVERAVPAGARVLVVSKGDEQLLQFSRRTGWHFLQTTNGVYAGHHPADSAAAIKALDRLRARGAQYLVFPKTAFWWLDHYDDFTRHLDRRFRIVLNEPRTCVIYALHASGWSR